MSDKTQKAINLLNEKYLQLKRLPKKDDFDDQDVAFIKGMLGPWPRALEKAGIKPITNKKINQIKTKNYKGDMPK